MRAGAASFGLAFALGGLALTLPSGGLGLAPALVIAAIACGLHGAGPLVAALRTPTALLALAFFLWTVASWTWAPRTEPDNFVKFVGVVFAAAVTVAAAARLDGRARLLARLALVAGLGMAAFPFAFEIVTGGAIASADRPPGEAIQALIDRNLGHGVSALILFLPAGAALAWTRGLWPRAAVLAAGAAALWGAADFGVEANIIGLVAAGVAGLAALRAPRATLWATGGLAAALIALAPAFGALAAAAPEGLRSGAPASWEMRLDIWTHVARALPEAFLFGHGFDASRAVTELAVLRGAIVYQAIPLHPHNAGLQVWYETGLVGAALLVAAIVIATRRVVAAPGLTRAQAAAIAATVAAQAAIGSVAYGAWQEWQLAAVALAACGCLLVGEARA